MLVVEGCKADWSKPSFWASRLQNRKNDKIKSVKPTKKTHGTHCLLMVTLKTAYNRYTTQHTYLLSPGLRAGTLVTSVSGLAGEPKAVPSKMND